VRHVLAGILIAVVAGAVGCGEAPAPVSETTAPPKTAAAPGALKFEEVASTSGLTFTHVSGASGRFYFVEQWGSGAAFLDYDSDGRMDVFLAQGGALPGYTGSAANGSRLFRNDGRGRFEDVSTAAGVTRTPYTLGVASADYDNDGDPDLFLTTSTGAALYENRDRRFVDVTAASGIRIRALATSAAFVDYDNDGRLDVFVARYQDYNLSTDRACASPSLGMPRPPGQELEYCGPGRPPVPNVLYRNEGNGRFRDVSKESGIAAVAARGLGVAIADLNQDGRIDIFVASDRAPNLLFVNNGSGRFVESAAAAGVAVNRDGVAYAGMGVDAADYDNDGWIDLVVTNYEHEPITLFHNEGHGLFTEHSERMQLTPLVFKFMKWGVRLLDFDLDGRKDLFVANGHLFPHLGEGTPLGLPIEQTRKGHAQEAQVFTQDVNGTFVERSVEAGTFFSERRVFRGAAFADVDDDGDWDALLTSVDGPVALLRNNTRGGQWARLRLEGVTSNRDAIGAVVSVTAGGRTQTAVVSSGGSYLSDHDRRLLFAFAEGAVAEIRWPCGATTRAPLQAGVTVVARESGCAK